MLSLKIGVTKIKFMSFFTPSFSKVTNKTLKSELSESKSNLKAKKKM